MEMTIKLIEVRDAVDGKRFGIHPDHIESVHSSIENGLGIVRMMNGTEFIIQKDLLTAWDEVENQSE